MKRFAKLTLACLLFVWYTIFIYQLGAFSMYRALQHDISVENLAVDRKAPVPA